MVGVVKVNSLVNDTIAVVVQPVADLDAAVRGRTLCGRGTVWLRIGDLGIDIELTRTIAAVLRR